MIEDLFSPENMERARQQRDEGIARALNGAERRAPGWADSAVEYVRAVAESNATFTSEQVRAVAERDGFETPKDKRAWGGVIRRAQGEGIMVGAGWTIASDPKVHCSPVTLWRSLIYRGASQ